LGLTDSKSLSCWNRTGAKFSAQAAIRQKERLFVAALEPCSRGLDVPTGRVEMPTVLVVEDEALIRELVAEELELAGYSIVIASDADQAIAILEARPDIHLVFTDINMPGSMDGLKLAAAIRDRWPPVHIIITSGKIRPLEIPANALFIPKPYVCENVVAVMRTFENMN
jgi:CheY-like chemotaxis protein